MYIHKEGHRLLTITFLTISAITALIVIFSTPLTVWHYLLFFALYAFWLALASFFRIPKRTFTEDETRLIAPADGRICTIEQVHEKEYLNCDCTMVSIFMFGTDVHVNRYPISGKVDYVKYHKGNYFIASHPKSSLMNERSSIGMILHNGQKILMRQVAGVMARRIVCYAKTDTQVKQNDEFGFIKFGSRIDLFLPAGIKIDVKIDDVVKNGISPVATIAL